MRHRFHSLCPYYAMFPERFAEEWIERLTAPGEVVMDPFCGRGTTPFQALLMGRQAVASDVNPVAYCVTKAKTRAPALPVVERRLRVLAKGFAADQWQGVLSGLPEFFHHAFHPDTLAQIAYLRDRLGWRKSDADCMIAAIVLGSLHGESHRSPAYLSNRMPRTISTKPAYSMRYWAAHGCRAPQRDAFSVVRDRLFFRYTTPPPAARGHTWNEDVRKLPELAGRFPGPVSCVVTSPPYLGVTHYGEDQWLRLWFLGGASRPSRGCGSPDDRYHGAARYWAFISDFWRALGAVLAPRAHVVIRLGAHGLHHDDIIDGLKLSARSAERPAKLKTHYVSSIRNRQTDVFRPGSAGCAFEVDCHFAVT